MDDRKFYVYEHSDRAFNEFLGMVEEAEVLRWSEDHDREGKTDMFMPIEMLVERDQFEPTHDTSLVTVVVMRADRADRSTPQVWTYRVQRERVHIRTYDPNDNELLAVA